MHHVSIVAMIDRVDPILQTLRRRRRGASYADVFEAYIDAPELRTAREAFERFTASTPLWAKILMRFPMRLRLALHFESNDAVVIGFDHRHLTYRSVLSLRAGTQTARVLRFDSAVLCHDGFGRAGIRLLAPLHRRLVRNALERLLAKTVQPRSR